MFLADKAKKSVKNKTKWRQIPSKNETVILQDLLKYDQEIYDFLVQRFEWQYKRIMESKKTLYYNSVAPVQKTDSDNQN